ncbi:hypothetical protein AD428_07090, partial [Achromobacter sp. DMS1]
AADAALPAADTGSDPHHLDAEGGYAVGLSDTDADVLRPAITRPWRRPWRLPPRTTCSIPTRAPARPARHRRWPPKTRPWPGGASDLDEYFDSAPIPAAAFDDPVPTYGPTPAAGAKPSSRPAADAEPSAPIPATKPPFKDEH